MTPGGAPIPSEACRERRRALLEACRDAAPGRSAAVVVLGRGADGPNPNFKYLLGIEEAAGALLETDRPVGVPSERDAIGRDLQRGRTVASVAFVPAHDPIAARWGEERFTTENVAPETVGVDAVLAAGRLDAVLGAALGRVDVLFVVAAKDAALVGDPDPAVGLAARARERFPGLETRDATGWVHARRSRKDDGEVAAIRRAVGLTHEAMTGAWSALRPGAVERELEAKIAERYRAAGAVHGFDPIVGSGPNACVLHYRDNDRTLREGELVLVDTGASLDGYCSDITRTVPVDGRFSSRQRELYDAVLAAQVAAIDACVVGATIGDVHAAAFDALDRAGLGDAQPHGTSHHLGIEVHDVGDRFAPLEEGAVVTVEPGVYLPDEAVGIRIEDDVRIGAAGPEVLSAAIPKEPDAVEAWIASRR